jgi:hypothetical protein
MPALQDDRPTNEYFLIRRGSRSSTAPPATILAGAPRVVVTTREKRLHAAVRHRYFAMHFLLPTPRTGRKGARDGVAGSDGSSSTPTGNVPAQTDIVRLTTFRSECLLEHLMTPQPLIAPYLDQSVHR